MTTTQSAFVPAVVVPDFDSFAVRQAIAGFLAEYGHTTRDAYTLDLRQWLGWCASHDLRVLAAKRPISSCLPGASNKTARPGRRWRVDCQRLPGSTGTASKNS